MVKAEVPVIRSLIQQHIPRGVCALSLFRHLLCPLLISFRKGLCLSFPNPHVSKQQMPLPCLQFLLSYLLRPLDVKLLQHKAD